MAEPTHGCYVSGMRAKSSAAVRWITLPIHPRPAKTNRFKAKQIILCCRGAESSFLTQKSTEPQKTPSLTKIIHMKTLLDLFEDELQDIYDAEHRISKALPKMADAATCAQLKAAFETHLQQTKGQIKKLESVFECFGWDPKAKTCEATVGLLEEGDEIAASFEGSPAINAALICAAQKVEHYEIASYGCLQAWAMVLENEAAANLLQEILDEEEATNDALTELSNAKNIEALGDPAAADASEE